jgi:hypothetical protein
LDFLADEERGLSYPWSDILNGGFPYKKTPEVAGYISPDDFWSYENMELDGFEPTTPRLPA